MDFKFGNIKKNNYRISMSIVVDKDLNNNVQQCYRSGDLGT